MLPLPPLTHFPAAKTGFTLSFWVRVGAQPADEPEVTLLPLLTQPHPQSYAYP